MTTQQPNWKLVKNLGDSNFADYGGLVLYEDTTGVYPPEAEYYFASDNETGGEVYRFILEPTVESWFDIDGIASFADWDKDELRAAFTSDDLVERARAYESVGHYHGFENLDSYPLRLTEAEAQERYKDVPTHYATV